MKVVEAVIRGVRTENEWRRRGTEVTAWYREIKLSMQGFNYIDIDNAFAENRHLN